MKEELLRFLEHAPMNVLTNPELAGWRLSSGEFVCNTCVARLMARGCWNQNASPVWNDEMESSPDCLLSEGHR
jgi:hypothetical protein